RSTYITSGGYDKISDAIFTELNVDGLFLEYDDERSGDFEPLKHFKGQDLTIVLGLITSKFPELEDVQEVKNRIEVASQYVNLNKIAIRKKGETASREEGKDPTEAEQENKPRHVV